MSLILKHLLATIQLHMEEAYLVQYNMTLSCLQVISDTHLMAE